MQTTNPVGERLNIRLSAQYLPDAAAASTSLSCSHTSVSGDSWLSSSLVHRSSLYRTLIRHRSLLPERRTPNEGDQPTRHESD